MSFNINHKINNRKVTAPVFPTSWPAAGAGGHLYAAPGSASESASASASASASPGYAGHFKGRDRDLHDVHAGSPELRSMNIRFFFCLFLV